MPPITKSGWASRPITTVPATEMAVHSWNLSPGLHDMMWTGCWLATAYTVQHWPRSPATAICPSKCHAVDTRGLAWAVAAGTTALMVAASTAAATSSLFKDFLPLAGPGGAPAASRYRYPISRLDTVATPSLRDPLAVRLAADSARPSATRSRRLGPRR